MTALHLIPAPSDVRAGSGALALDDLVAIEANHPDALGVAELFRGDLEKWTGRSFAAPELADGARAGAVRFELTGDGPTDRPLDPASAEALGAHVVEVHDRGVRVTAAHREGLYRGAASVVQLLATHVDELPVAAITDEARWAWRGLSLDAARWFVPVEHVKRVVDLLALYKFNVLHLHLSDNEGWRLAIPGWPLLTEAEHGQHFSTDDLREIVAYAAERFVTVVPEIDLPGHVATALRAYPALNPDLADGLSGPFPIANLGTDAASAWQLVDDAIRTLAEHTAGPLIHVGGDEAFGMAPEAHAAFVEHALAAVRAHGKRTVGWQETTRADVGPEHLAQYWFDLRLDDAGGDSGFGEPTEIPSESLAAMSDHFIEAMKDGARIAEKGCGVVVSPLSHTYLDRPHGEASVIAEQEERRPGLGMQYYPGTPLQQYLEWDPTEVLPDVDPTRIAGVEAAVWGESVTGIRDIEALILPRLPAVAEVAWGAGPERTWPEFRARLAQHAPMWSARDWNWFASAAVEWSRP